MHNSHTAPSTCPRLANWCAQRSGTWLTVSTRRHRQLAWTPRHLDHTRELRLRAQEGARHDSDPHPETALGATDANRWSAANGPAGRRGLRHIERKRGDRVNTSSKQTNAVQTEHRHQRALVADHAEVKGKGRPYGPRRYSQRVSCAQRKADRVQDR